VGTRWVLGFVLAYCLVGFWVCLAYCLVGFWVGYSWVLYLGFNWATYVYSLVYLEAHALFLIYITLLIKKKASSCCWV
jgi:hypothetical protein